MKSLFFHIIFLTYALNSTAQKAEYFEFLSPPKIMSYSVFDKVEIVDSRLNQDYIGIKQKGNSGKLVPIWLHASLSAEIKTWIDSAINNVPQEPHTVLINFRNFFINKHTGQFEFHAECYAKWDDEYWLAYYIDSSYKFRGSVIEKKVSEVLSNFINTLVHLDLSKRKQIRPVSFEYISAIDINEKKTLPVFNVTKPERGVYYSYDEFKNNKPRLTVFNVVKGRNELKGVFRLPVGNKLAKKIPRDSLYAVCDGDDTWIAASNEYAHLNKRGLDFFFQATAYENNKIEEISLSYYFFGLPGGIIAAIPRKALFEFRLNHINGKFILLRRAADRN